MIFQGRFDHAPRENVFSSENYRSKIQTASPLPVTVRAWFLRISIPRVFLERGSDIPDENKRIKGRHCWSFLEKRSSRDCFSLFLSRGEIVRIVVDQIFLSSRLVGQTQLCVSRVHSVKGKLVTIVTNGEAGKVLSRFTRFLGRRWCSYVGVRRQEAKWGYDIEKRGSVRSGHQLGTYHYYLYENAKVNLIPSQQWPRYWTTYPCLISLHREELPASIDFFPFFYFILSFFLRNLEETTM